MSSRQVEWGSLSAVGSVVALVGVVIAIKAGILPPRFWPVAGFLALWAGSAIFISITSRIQRARVSAPRGASVPLGVRLRTPTWAVLGDSLYIVGVGARIGVVAALLGFAGVGVGVLLASIALSAGMYSMRLGIGVNSLTLESEGMRVYIKGASVFIPWTGIADVEREGKDEVRKLVFLQLKSHEAVLKTLDPNTVTTRSRLQRLTLGQTKLMLVPWIGGLDSTSLVRAINTAIGREPHRSN